MVNCFPTRLMRGGTNTSALDAKAEVPLKDTRGAPALMRIHGSVKMIQFLSENYGELVHLYPSFR